MVEIPPVVGATTSPLLYTLFQYHDSPSPAVGRYDDRGCLPTLLSLLAALLRVCVLLYHWCISERRPRPALLTQRELIDQPLLVLCYTWNH